MSPSLSRSALQNRVVGRDDTNSHRREATDRPTATDGGRVVVPVSDRASLEGELKRLAGDAFEKRPDGTLTCNFAGVTHFTVLPDGRLDTGMPLHSFTGPADRFVFDHERGEVTVEVDTDDETLSYTFRRP